MDTIEHRVRERAYYIWEGEGRVTGRAEAHWIQAEIEIAAARVETAPAAQPSVKKAPARAKAPAKAAAAKPAPKAAAAKAPAKPKKAPRASETGIALH